MSHKSLIILRGVYLSFVGKALESCNWSCMQQNTKSYKHYKHKLNKIIKFEGDEMDCNVETSGQPS